MAKQWPPEATDKELVKQIQQEINPNEAFETFYKKWFKAIEQHRFLKTLSIDDREDIVATTWEKIWKGLKTVEYRGDGQFQAWLFKILKHTCIDYLRRQERLKEILSSVSLNDEAFLEDDTRVELIETIRCEPEQDTIDQEQRELVVEAAERCLKKKELELVKRRMLREPLPANWSESLINTYWHRAKKKIIRDFKGE